MTRSMAMSNRWVFLTRLTSLVGIAVFAAVVLFVPPESQVAAIFNTWVYGGLMVLACVIAGSRALIVPRQRFAWIAITLAIMSWTFGEVWYAVAKPESYPSPADYGFLGFYPLLYIGIVGLVRARARTIGKTLWLDGAIASLSVAAFGAAVLVELVLTTTEGSLSAVVTNLAYPLGDLLLFSAVFGVFSLTGWRPGWRWLLLGLGMLSTGIADAVYLFKTADGTYVEGTWIDIFWPLAILLVASAAWMRDPKAASLDDGVEGRPLLAVPTVAALLGTGVFVYDHFERVNLLAVGLATSTLLMVVLRLAVTFRENSRLFEHTLREATTDALTGLGNRRKLLADLDRGLAEHDPAATLLVTFDLDGFKGYNDSFGHPSGDALLARLGSKLASSAGAGGAAYRLGGDEFCLTAPVRDAEPEQLIDRACRALTEQGEGFEIGTSFGAVLLPQEAREASEALQLADERLYAHKRLRHADSDRTIDSLLTALFHHEPDLSGHLEGVAALAVETGQQLGLDPDALVELSRAARLQDVGKLAVPYEILRKPGLLDEVEWVFMRQHTVVAERILRASPALRSVATIVRSTHENWDGTGYPDGLAGEEIPLAARIIRACDAYDAMTSRRLHAPVSNPVEALEQLELGAGTQFDPTVSRVLAEYLRHRLEAERAA